MSLKIYSYPNNYRVWKALIAAKYGGIDVEVVDSKAADLKGKSPIGKAPILETAHGNLFESNAIAKYVAGLRADTGLLGNTYFEAAQVNQWIDYSANEFEAARAIWLYPVKKIMVFNGRAYGEAKKDVSAFLKALNAYLLNNTFLVGNQITLADITIVCALVEMYTTVFAPGYLRQFGNVTRWFNTCINQDEFASVIGKVEFTKSEKRAPKPPKVENKNQGKKGGNQGKKKKSNKGQQQKPKPKPKGPVDLLKALPKSKMNLDATKKAFFAKQPFVADYFSDQWFDEKFDAEGYSFWTGDYMYNDENLIQWQTANLIGGWIQRLDLLRKFGMGVVRIVSKGGENKPPFKITSMWLFRGKEYSPAMKDCSDAEYYTWKKIDTKSKEGRAKIVEYFTDENKCGEDIVLDNRFFK